MQKIGGVWFLVLGIVMVGFSGYVQNKNPDAKMMIFIIVGAGFIAIGTFKLVSKAILQGHDQNSVAKVSPHLAKLQRQKQQALMDIEREKQARLANQRGGQSNQQNSAQYTSSPQASSRNIHTQNTGAQQMPQIVDCPKCFAQNYSSNNFCYSCGTRLR